MLDLSEIVEFRASQELLGKLQKYCVQKTLPAGSVILNENADICSIPIVIKGSLRVIRTEENGREILLYYVNAGESCVMSLLGKLHNETSKIRAEAEDDVVICFLSSDKVAEFIKEYPQWVNYIFKLYNKRFNELLEVINSIAFKKMDVRLLELLQKKSNLSGSKTIQTTHEQLANELGTARVVVSRLLKHLEDDNVIKLGREKITFV